MEKFPVPKNEEQRLKALENYEILDSLAEPDFDRITELASLICETPVSLVALLDEKRQWYKSKVGLEIPEMPRELAFCNYAILDTTLLEVNDATKDDRFKQNPLVAGDTHMRFYAGHPLIDNEGYALGSLCVIDDKPRELSEIQRKALTLLAQEATALIIERRKKEELRHFDKLFALSNDLICIADTDGCFKKINPAFKKILGWEESFLLSTCSIELVHPDDLKQAADDFDILAESKGESTFVHRVRTASGAYKTIQWQSSPEPGTGNIFCIGRDISLERLKEQRVKISEERLRIFFENSQGLMCTHDLEGNFISVNVAGASILGYTVAEMESMSLFSIVPHELYDRVDEYLAEIKANKNSVGEMLALHKDGSYRSWVFNNVLEKNRDGQPYVIGNAIDITLKNQLEKDLKRTKELLEETNQVARVGGWELDVNRQTVHWTDITKEIHGVPANYQPLLENALHFYKEGQSRDKIKAAISIAVAVGEPWDMELQIIDTQRREVWVRVIGKADFSHGRCKRLFGTFQDIDKQKRSAVDLLSERARLAALVEHTPAAIAMVDTEMKFIAVSKQYLQDYGIAGQNIIGATPYDIFENISEINKEAHQKVLDGAIEKREEVKISLPGVDHDEFVNIEMRPWYEFDNKIGGIMMSSQKVTNIINQREELRKSKLEADQASIAKSEFLANMSHEIRTPLNGVIGFTDLVLKTRLDETQQQYLSIVNQSANALLSIINDILDFSKIEAGKLELDIEKCDLYEISSQSTDIITYEVQRKGLEMLLNISYDLPRFIWVDLVRLKQILINLLSNAAKFTERGEIELKIEELTNDGPGTRLRFSVRDTGIGIMPARQDKIFEAFAQEDSSTTKKYGGTGLGLTISNKLLNMMGSRLQLQSLPGKGSVFYFDITVPAEQGEPANWVNIDQVKNVLIVDDNANNRIILKQILLLKDITSAEAKNGFEALQLLAAGEQYDVILMDYHMPYMDGLETIKKIRESFNEDPDVHPIILLHSSSDDEKVIRTCEDLNVCQRLVKPIKAEDIYNVLSRLHKDKNEPTVNNLPAAIEPVTDNITVLLAEDNVVNMLLARVIINRIAPNAVIQEAKNGEEAVAYCTERLPDLILMDIQMPFMNGYEATRHIREMKGGELVPIIALTAGNVKSEREKCLAAGMDDFIVKPVVEETIAASFDKWLHHYTKYPQEQQPKNEHCDLSGFEQFIGDDPELLKEIVTLSKDELKRASISFKMYTDNKDLAAINAVGHKLNGTAVTLGLTSLAAIAVAYEQLTSFSERNMDELLLKARQEISLVISMFDERLARADMQD